MTSSPICSSSITAQPYSEPFETLTTAQQQRVRLPLQRLQDFRAVLAYGTVHVLCAGGIALRKN